LHLAACRSGYWLVWLPSLLVAVCPAWQEKLATHPVGRRYLSGQEVLAYGRALVGGMARRLSQDGLIGQTKSLNHFTRYALPGGDNYTEWLITAPNLADRYWGEHFDLPNIVAHVRTSERKTPHGTRVLLMEEIQSDWNQALREAIRQSQQPRPAVELIEVEWDEDIEAPPDNPYLNHWLDAALGMMLLLAVQRGFSGVAWLPSKLHAERFPWANADGLATFYDRIVPAAVEKLAKSWDVQLGVAQFETLSRRYRVVRHSRSNTWRVEHRVSMETVGEAFTDLDAADKYCQSQEVPVMEEVGALYLTDAMRADILENGLPCLGAIGKRAAAVSPAPTFPASSLLPASVGNSSICACVRSPSSASTDSSSMLPAMSASHTGHWLPRESRCLVLVEQVIQGL
jgi:hypothetical protein